MSNDVKTPESSRESKRAQFAQGAEGGSGRNAFKVLAVVAVALVGLVAYVATGSGGGRATTIAKSGAVRAEAEGVSVPLSELGAKARFYEYKAASGKTVRFFALKSSDGAYRAALDACDVCFAAKKGYRQEGDDMVCNNCGNHFHSAQVNEVHGGCNPVGLERKVAGDRLNISAEELEAGASYF
jgi:uncharacterized membrane protein